MRAGRMGLAILVAWICAANCSSHPSTPSATAPQAPLLSGWANERMGLPVDPLIRIGALSNGFRYYVEPNDGPHGAVSLRLVIEAGAMHDPDGQEGLTHLLAHVVADNAPEASSLKVHPRPADSVFASIFALDLDRGTPASVEEAIAELSALASRPLPLGGFDTAIRTIADETNTADALKTFAPLATSLRDEVMGDHPARRPTVSDAGRLASLPPTALRAFHSAHYRPERAMLVVVGSVDPETTARAIEAKFTAWRGTGEIGHDPTPLAALPPGPDVVIKPNEDRSGVSLLLLNTLPYRDAYRDTNSYREAFVDMVALSAACQRTCPVLGSEAAKQPSTEHVFGPIPNNVPKIRLVVSMSASASEEDAPEMVARMIAIWKQASAGVTEEELQAAIKNVVQQAENKAGSRRLFIRTESHASALALSLPGKPLVISAVQELALTKSMSSTLTLAEVNASLKRRLGVKPRLVATGKITSASALTQAMTEAWESE